METLADTIEYVLGGRGHGVICPACGQFAKDYERPLNSLQASALITCYRAAGDDWFHAPSLVGRAGGEFAKLRHWGLIEGGDGHAGRWRITPKGIDFLFRRIRVPQRARYYAGEFLGLVGAENWTIDDALGKKFDYAELMGDAQEEK